MTDSTFKLEDSAAGATMPICYEEIIQDLEDHIRKFGGVQAARRQTNSGFLGGS